MAAWANTSSTILGGLWQLLFPSACPACRRRLPVVAGVGLCPACRDAIRYLRHPLCRQCGREVAGEPSRRPLCGECLRHPPPFTLCRSIVRYEPCISRLLHRLKYHGDCAVLPAMAELVSGWELSEYGDCQAIVPVPLHIDRHRRRGINQATLLARLFFSGRAVEIRGDLLLRIRDTPSQTRLSGEARRNNLDGAFTVRAGAPLPDLACLVDDVFTTGATVSECAKTLLKQGVREVRVLTLARADRVK